MNIKSIVSGKKRFAAAAVVAAGLGSGAFAYANSLTPVSNTLGAGSVAVNATTNCVPTFSYTTSWDSTTSHFDVATVTATAASPTTGCNGVMVQAELTGLNASSLGNLPAKAYAGGDGTAQSATAVWTVSTAINSADVTGISGAVTGNG